MANPFEEMFRGNYKNPPPESKGRENEQFAEINESEEVRLLEAAKMKAEGIMLYAPLTEEVKEVFLAKLSEISDGALSDLRYELNNPRGSTPENIAGLIVNRRLRGVLDKVKNQMTPREHELLTWAIEGLYCGADSYTDKYVIEWMNGKSE